MNIIICKDYEEVSKKSASLLIKEMMLNKKLKLGLATGSTPIGMYKNLIKAYDTGLISFENVTTFNLDEYVGIDRLHPQSYYHYMFEQLFKYINIQKENINIPNNDVSQLDDLAMNYENILQENQRDIQILGIGKNGHIGFNEPGTSFGSETFIVELDDQTRIDNSRFFSCLEEVPKYAITMGIKDIMYSKKIVLIAAGKEKAYIINKAINGELTNDIPASILQLHPDVTIMLDEEAASELDNRNL
jgi:glucosamine-6-phosphate deaminase